MMFQATSQNSGISISPAICPMVRSHGPSSRANFMYDLWQPLQMLPRLKSCKECGLRLSTSSSFTFVSHSAEVASRTTFAKPIVSWDCHSKEEVLLRPYALLFAGDNPMQAELCSCAGLSTNHPCRTCKAGGSQEYKKSEKGFAEMLKVS